MAWTVTFVRDTELPEVGTVTARWTSGSDTFILPPERVDGKAALGGFVTKAKAALAAWQAKQVSDAAIAAKIAQALNA